MHIANDGYLDEEIKKKPEKRSEVGPLEKTSLKIMNATKLNFTRRVGRKSKLDRIRILNKPRKMVRICSKNECKNNVEKVLNWIPQERWKRGRPGLSWRKEIINDTRRERRRTSLDWPRPFWPLLENFFFQFSAIPIRMILDCFLCSWFIWVLIQMLRWIIRYCLRTGCKNWDQYGNGMKCWKYYYLLRKNYCMFGHNLFTSCVCAFLETIFV